MVNDEFTIVKPSNDLLFVDFVDSDQDEETLNPPGDELADEDYKVNPHSLNKNSETMASNRNPETNGNNAKLVKLNFENGGNIRRGARLELRPSIVKSAHSSSNFRRVSVDSISSFDTVFTESKIFSQPINEKKALASNAEIVEDSSIFNDTSVINPPKENVDGNRKRSSKDRLKSDSEGKSFFSKAASSIGKWSNQIGLTNSTNKLTSQSTKSLADQGGAVTKKELVFDQSENHTDEPSTVGKVLISDRDMSKKSDQSSLIPTLEKNPTMDRLFDLVERENTNFSVKLSYDHPFEKNFNRSELATPHTYMDMTIDPNIKLAEMNAIRNREITVVDLDVEQSLNRKRFSIDSNTNKVEFIEPDPNEAYQIQKVRSEQVTPDIYETLTVPPKISIYSELKFKLNQKFKKFTKKPTTTTTNSKASGAVESKVKQAGKKLDKTSKKSNYETIDLATSSKNNPSFVQTYQRRVSTKPTLSEILNGFTTRSSHDSTSTGSIFLKKGEKKPNSRQVVKPHKTIASYHTSSKLSLDTTSQNLFKSPANTASFINPSLTMENVDVRSMFRSEDGSSSVNRDKDQQDYLSNKDEYIRRVDTLIMAFRDKEIVNKEANAAGTSRSKPVVAHSQASKSVPKKNALKEFKYCVLTDLKIGEGEFGETFQGYRYDLGAPIKIAAKRLKQLKDKDDQSSINFFAEIAVLSQLDKHPNVIEYLGVHKYENSMYIIFEYAEKGDLKRFLDQCRKNSKREFNMNNLFKVKMAYEIASGMEYISSLDIVHKDLAARNILLDKDFTCKVADFGCCKCDFLKKRPIRWMAPESLCKLLFTTSSDVWSFGVLMWEIYTYGTTPYPGMTDDEVVGRINQWYRLYKPHDCPNEVYSIMLSCWKDFHKARPRFSHLKHKLKELFKTMFDSQYSHAFQNSSINTASMITTVNIGTTYV